MERSPQEANTERNKVTANQEAHRRTDASADEQISPQRGTEFPNIAEAPSVEVADEKNVEQHYTQAQLAEQLWSEQKESLLLVIGQQERIQEATEAVLYWKRLGEGYSTLAQEKPQGEAEKFQSTATACFQAAEAAKQFVEATRVTFSQAQQGEFLQNVNHLIARTPLGENPHYAKADILWNQREKSWDNHREAHRQHQEHLREQILAEEKMRIAQENDEQRDDNRLGKIKKRIEQLATVLHGVPEPHTQLTATAANTAASVLDAINTIWTKVDRYQAEFHKATIDHRVGKAQEKAEQANIEIVALEKQARVNEEAALHQERVSAAVFKALRPREGWWQHEWETWSATVLKDISLHDEKAKIDFIQQARENIDWIIYQTAHAWQERLEQTKQQWQQVIRESKKNLTPLKHLFVEAKTNQQEQEKITKQAHTLLQDAYARQKELKKTIEAFLNDHEEEEWNQQNIEHHRQTFCVNFDSLLQTSQKIDRYQQQWEEEQRQQLRRNLQVFCTSQDLERTQREYDRLLSRLETRFQTDQEHFRHVWPEFDPTFRPCLQWELPVQPTAQELPLGVEVPPQSWRHPHEGGDPAIVATISTDDFNAHEAIEPPLKPLEECERQGRAYLHHVMKAIEEVLHPKKTILLSAATTATQQPFSSLKLSSSSSSSSPSATTDKETTDDSSATSTTPHEVLLAWSLEQLDRPSIAEQQRWKACAQLDRLRAESDKLARALQQGPNEQSGGSLISASTRASNQKASPSLSGVTTGTRSTITVRNSILPQNLQEQFERARQDEKQAEDRWFRLMEQAERGRLAQGGEPFVNEEAKAQAWEEADRQAVQERTRRKELFQEKRSALAEEENWQENNRRWRARDAADLAVNKFQELEKERINLKDRKELTGLARRQEGERLDTALDEARDERAKREIAWIQLAEQHKSILKLQDDDALAASVKEKKINTAIKELKAFDQATMHRWGQFEESQGPIDPEKAAQQQTPLSYELTLGLHLQEQEQRAFTTASTVTLGIEQYQQAAIEEALTAAKENIPGAAAAWKERIARGQTQLRIWEQQLSNPEASAKEVAGLRGRLSQLCGVVAADQKASAIFEKEMARLNRIEGIWKNISTAQQEQQFQKAQAAALRYHQGDATPWGELTEEERRSYNDAIAQKNQKYNQALASEELLLSESKKKIDAEEKRAKQFLSRFLGSMTGKQKAALAFLRQAQEYYTKRYTALAERKEAIQEALRLSGMTPSEREHDLQEKIRLKKEDRFRAFEKEMDPWLRRFPDLADQADKQSIKAEKAAARARARGDAKAAILNEDIYMAWGVHGSTGAIYAYEHAGRNMLKGNIEPTIMWRKSAEAYEAGAKALARKDERTANLHLNVAYAYEHVGKAYEQAIEEQTKGNREAAAAYRKSVEAGEAQVEALLRGDKKAAELLEQIAKTLGGEEHYPGAGFTYRQAAEEQAQGNSEAAAICRKTAEFFEAEAEAWRLTLEAFIRGDEKTAALHRKRAKTFAELASAYSDNEVIPSFGIVKSYESAVVAFQAALECLTQGNTKTATLHEKLAEALGGWRDHPGSAFMYSEVMTLSSSCWRTIDESDSEYYLKGAKAYKVATTIFETALDALVRRDEVTADRHEKLAEVFKKIGFSCYVKATKENTDCREAATTYCKVAEAYVNEAMHSYTAFESLAQGDTRTAALHEQIAETYRRVGIAYEKTCKEFVKKNSETAVLYQKTAESFEAEAEALLQGDKTACSFLEKTFLTIEALAREDEK